MLNLKSKIHINNLFMKSCRTKQEYATLIEGNQSVTSGLSMTMGNEGYGQPDNKITVCLLIFASSIKLSNLNEKKKL